VDNKIEHQGKDLYHTNFIPIAMKLRVMLQDAEAHGK